MATLETKTRAALPEGYTVKPMSWDYAAQAVDLFNAYSRHYIQAELDTVEDMTQEWKSPGYHLETDAIVVFSPDGRLIAYCDLWDISPVHINLYGYVNVHPEEQGKGIGSYLQEWLEQRARQQATLAAEGVRSVLLQYQFSTNESAARLLRSAGYEHVRSSWQMGIELDRPAARPVVPDGIVIRSIDYEREYRAVSAAAQDAFRDHWGFVDEPFESYYERMRHFAEDDPHFDPTLYFAAWDGDEVVGVSLCKPQTSEDPEMAWIGTVGVRKAWRKQGIALAMLLHSFNEFYRRGIKRAALTVDSASLTGATRVYEKAGMHVMRQYDRYEKEVRSGTDIRTGVSGH